MPPIIEDPFSPVFNRRSGLIISPFVSIGRLPEGRKATPFSADGKREYTEQYLVEMDNTRWGPFDACLCPGLPLPWSPFVDYDSGAFDLRARCISIEGEHRAGSDVQHIVTCKFSTDVPRGGFPNYKLPGDKSGKGDQNHPELEPPEVDWDYEEVNVPSLRDLDGNPFINSAWDAFNPAPTLNHHRPILVITRNELNYNEDAAGLMAGAVNDKPFGNRPPSCVMCMAPKAKQQNKGGYSYFRVTYRIKFGYKKELVNLLPGELGYESFQHEELDQGFYERLMRPGLGAAVGTNIAQRIHIVDENNRPIRQPALLDGTGKKQRRTVPWIIPQGGLFGPLAGAGVVPDKRPLPVYIRFRTRRAIDFTVLFKRGLAAIH